MSKIPNKFFCFVLGLTISLSSCDEPTWLDLGDNYTYYLDGRIAPVDLYYNTQIYSDITSYSFDDNYIIAKQKPDYKSYKAQVASDYFDHFFIFNRYLLDTTPERFNKENSPFTRQAIKADSNFYKLLKSKGVTDQNSLDDTNIIQTIVDSVFRADTFYIKLFSSTENYWLIDKKKNIRFGPLTKQEFNNKSRELNIKLKLD
ncbi:MAG: DUF3997 domain-containing protein [Bacteroidia bacterium]